jgi:hypothetical protein
MSFRSIEFAIAFFDPAGRKCIERPAAIKPVPVERLAERVIAGVADLLGRELCERPDVIADARSLERARST